LPRAARVLAFLKLCLFDPVTQESGQRSAPLALCAGSSLPYDARPGSPGFDTEVSHATQERAPRRRLVSRSPVNEGRASLPRLGSNAERASLAATKSSVRSSVATIRARASLAGDFNNCCMQSGEFDGSDRHHFFQRLMTSLTIVGGDRETQCVLGRGTR